MEFFQTKIRPNYKTKKEALREYLKKIVIFQSTNKKCASFNPMRKATINLTQRQIAQRTGLSLGLVNQVLREMREDGIIKIAQTKPCGQYNDIIFFYFVDIFKAIIKKLSYKYSKAIHGKVNTKNNLYNKLRRTYKKIYWKMLFRQVQDKNIHYDPVENKYYTDNRDLFYLDRVKKGIDKKITWENIFSLLEEKETDKKPLQRRKFQLVNDCPF